jgi:hypothetical protein
MAKKKNVRDLTARNLSPLKVRLTKLEQAIVLLHGDINKINVRLAALEPTPLEPKP